MSNATQIDGNSFAINQSGYVETQEVYGNNGQGWVVALSAPATNVGNVWVKLTNTSNSAINYVVMFQASGMHYLHNNNSSSPAGSFTEGDAVTISFDGTTVYYSVNGVLKNSVVNAMGACDLRITSYIGTADVHNVRFYPTGPAGADGPQGAAGTDIETAPITVGLTGGASFPHTHNFRLYKVGQAVFLENDGTINGGNSMVSTGPITFSPIPSAYWPSHERNFVVYVEGVELQANGVIEVGADGVINIYQEWKSDWISGETPTVLPFSLSWIGD